MIAAIPQTQISVILPRSGGLRSAPSLIFRGFSEELDMPTRATGLTARVVHFTSVALALVALSGCPETKVVCPDGYYAKATFCYPDPPADTVGGASAKDVNVVADGGKPDTGKAGQADTGLGDSAQVDTGAGDIGTGDTGGADTAADTGLVDSGPADTGPADAGPAKSPVGAACQDDLDCLNGLSCFGYAKGYCTLLNCGGATTCPGSSVCWGKTPKSQLCNADCVDNSDCRVADGYGCKRLSSKFGGIDANLCLPGGKSKHGQNCTAPLDCEGDDTCLTDMDGGYCGRIGCSISDPCPGGTACVMRDGKPTCLKTCTGSSQCQVSGKQPRTCVKRTDLGKKLVEVCLDSAKAAPIGADCGADLDCDSGKCITIAKGTCKTGDAPCLADSQCGNDGPCVLDPKKEKGVCGQPCANDKGCPTGSACVPSIGSTLTGSCQPNCQGPGDTATCKVPGTVCVFGQPIAPPNGIAAATHACGPQPKGSPGAPCTTLADCDSKDCTTNATGSAGYCTATCSGSKPCPFGSVCITAGLAFCERMCSVDVDCPAQMACKSSGKAGVKTCQLN